MTISAYTVIKAKQVNDFNTLVAAAIANSYQPYGPMIYSDHDGEFIQAMALGIPNTSQTNDVTTFEARTTALETATGNVAPVVVTPTTGQTVTVTPVGALTTELIQPAGTLAALTLTLANGAKHGQMILVKFGAIITALTVTNTNIDITPFTLPTSAAVNDVLRFVWDNTATKWTLI